MLKQIIVDANKRVRITAERGAKDAHRITISRLVKGEWETVVSRQDIANGPKHKPTFEYPAFPGSVQYKLEPEYLHDDVWHASSFKEVPTGDPNHLLFNYHDSNARDDEFDLQVHFYMIP